MRRILRISINEYPLSSHGFPEVLSEHAIERYWAQKTDERGLLQWRFPVKEILGACTPKQKQAFERFNRAHVWLSEGTCAACGEEIGNGYSSRTAFHTSQWGDLEFCSDCAGVRAEIEKQEQEARKKKQQEEREQRCREAALAGAHESLNDLEFNFLLALVQRGNYAEAAKAVGLSLKFADKIFTKLAGWSLVVYERETNKYHFVEELKEALRTAAPRKRFKSVFGSPQAEKLYRVLKRTHAYVFPEVPLCAFVDELSVESILNEQWKKYYFRSCRVDFLIADRAGLPLACVEYDGTYHEEDQRQQEKDRFKEDLLAHAGLPLERISAKELSELEKASYERQETA